jgi:hypothetical protein
MLSHALNGEFAMPGLRLDRLIALTLLVFPLMSPRASLADPIGAIVDVDKPVPNAMTVEPPADADSERATEKPAGSDAKTAPNLRKEAAPVTAPDRPFAHPDAAGTATTTSTPNLDRPIPTATTNVSAATNTDAPITEQLRNLANGKFDHIIGSTSERISIDAFYSGRNYVPLWITEGKANARAEAAIAYLGGVSADGLDPIDYPVPDFASLADPAALAEAEISLTTSVISYVRHAQIGQVHWSRVSGDIFSERTRPRQDSRHYGRGQGRGRSA